MSHNHKMGLSSPSSVSIIQVSGSNHHSLGNKNPVSVLQPSLLTANNQNRKTSLHSVLNVGSVQLPAPGSNVVLSKPLLHRNAGVTLPDSTSTSSTTMVTSIMSNKTGSDLSTSMSAGRKRSTTNTGTKGRGKTLMANPSAATDLDMGCMGQQSALSRKNSRSAIAGHAPPASVARRNARERNRVKQVNNGFASLRQHIPLQVLLSMASESGNSSPTATSQGGKKNKISKVDTLRCAVEYIRSLEQILADTDPENTEPHMNSNSPMIKSEWMSTCGSPNGMNGALMQSDGLHSQHLYHGESSAEELIDTSSEFNEEPYGCDEENISPGNSIARHLKVENNNDDATLFHQFTFEEPHHDQHMHQAAVAEAEYAMQTATLAMAPNDRKGHLNPSPPQQHLFPTAQTLPSLNRAFPGRALSFMLPQQEQALLFHSKDKQSEDPSSSQDEDLDSIGSHSGSADSANLLIDSWWLIPSM